MDTKQETLKAFVFLIDCYWAALDSVRDSCDPKEPLPSYDISWVEKLSEHVPLFISEHPLTINRNYTFRAKFGLELYLRSCKGVLGEHKFTELQLLNEQWGRFLEQESAFNHPRLDAFPPLVFETECLYELWLSNHLQYSWRWPSWLKEWVFEDHRSTFEI